MKCHVKITEKLEKTVIVETDSSREAMDFVKNAYYHSKIVLDADDFVGEDFAITEVKRKGIKMKKGYSIDFKVTTWERIVIHDKKDFKRVLSEFKEGRIENNEDVYGLTPHTHFERLDDVIEEMTVAENDGNSTIEIMEDGLCIWGNGDEFKEEVK